MQNKRGYKVAKVTAQHKGRKTQEWIGNASLNHKVEQVLRAILLPLDDSYSTSVHTIATNTLSVSAVKDTIIQNITPEWYAVGISTAKGWGFTPLQNSMLSLLGIKPSVALFTLCSQGLRDLEAPESEGKAPATVEKGDKLLTFAPALITAAYRLVMRYQDCVNDLNEFVAKYGDYPKHFAQSVKG